MDNFKFKLKNEFIKDRVYTATCKEDAMIDENESITYLYYEVTWDDEVGNGKVNCLIEEVNNHLINEAWIKVE